MYFNYVGPTLLSFANL